MKPTLFSAAKVPTFSLPLHFLYTSLVGQMELCLIVHLFVLFYVFCQTELLKARNMSSFMFVRRLGRRRKNEFYRQNWI